MLNYKELAENILTDVMNNGSLPDILLKTKIFATNKRDSELLAWISNELDGYTEEKLPEYRALRCGLNVDVFIPYQRHEVIDFPIDVIENDVARKNLSTMDLYIPISEIESLCKNAEENGIIKRKVPVFTYPIISKYIRYGEIQDMYQYVTTAAVLQILTSVKSLLIDFLLKVSDEEQINFNSFIQNKPNMITINASIVNTGNGDVNAQGFTNVVGDNNIISEDNKQELLRILAEIDKISATQHNSEYDEVSKDIKTELQKDKPEKKLLKRCFQLIPSFLTGVAASATGNGLTQLITSALALL